MNIPNLSLRNQLMRSSSLLGAGVAGGARDTVRAASSTSEAIRLVIGSVLFVEIREVYSIGCGSQRPPLPPAHSTPCANSFRNSGQCRFGLGSSFQVWPSIVVYTLPLP